MTASPSLPSVPALPDRQPFDLDQRLLDLSPWAGREALHPELALRRRARPGPDPREELDAIRIAHPRWYPASGAQPNDVHEKMLLLAPDLDRCDTIGFRCVVDLAS